MPTQKPRISVTLPPEVNETIEAWANLQGSSKSAVIGELLIAVHPSLMRTVALFQAAKDAPQQIQMGLIETVEELHTDLEKGLGISLQRIDGIAASARSPDTGRRTRKRSNPRSSNTGVRSTKKTKKGK